MAMTNGEDRGRILTASAAGLLLLAVLQLVIGIILATKYQDNVAQAHASVEMLRHDSLFGLLVKFHYWGSALLIVLSLLHVVAMLWTGRYRRPYTLDWIGSLGLFVSSLIFQISGNLLPFDRHDVSTAVVEGGISSGAPVLGPTVAKVMMNGKGFNDGTLGLWNMAHAIIIPLLFIVLVAPAVRAFLRSDKQKLLRLPLFVPTALTLICAFLVSAPHGAPATADDYNNYGAQVSWYTWPLHGSLEAFNHINPSLGWIGSIAIPTLFIAILVLLPKLSDKLSLSAIRGVFLAFAAYFLVVANVYGGKFAPLTGNQDAKEEVVSNPQPDKSSFNAALAAKGRDLFNKVGCSDCHGKDGKEAIGGPNLAKSDKKRSDVTWYVAFIKAPSKVKPGSTMPGFDKLSADELSALAEYLAHPH